MTWQLSQSVINTHRSDRRIISIIRLSWKGLQFHARMLYTHILQPKKNHRYTAGNICTEHANKNLKKTRDPCSKTDLRWASQARWHIADSSHVCVRACVCARARVCCGCETQSVSRKFPSLSLMHYVHINHAPCAVYGSASAVRFKHPSLGLHATTFTSPESAVCGTLALYRTFHTGRPYVREVARSYSMHIRWNSFSWVLRTDFLLVYPRTLQRCNERFARYMSRGRESRAHDADCFVTAHAQFCKLSFRCFNIIWLSFTKL